MVRTVNIALALVFAAGSAQAQITTYVAPPRAPAPTPQTVAAADSARRDSVTQMASNMKAWVDSAAGVPVPATVGRVDSAALINDPGRITPVVSEPERPVTNFSDGSVAPATASNLPTLAIIGVVFLVLGSALLANRPRG
jgi:hypothetical protein